MNVRSFAAGLALVSQCGFALDIQWDCNNGAMLIGEYTNPFEYDRIYYKAIVRDDGVAEYLRREGFDGNDDPRNDNGNDFVVIGLKPLVSRSGIPYLYAWLITSSTEYRVIPTFTGPKMARIELRLTKRGGENPPERSWVFESCRDLR